MSSIPELPDDVCRMISQLSLECVKDSVFQLDWVKQNNILQAVIHLSPTHIRDAFDMDRIADTIRSRMVTYLPEAMPFFIDRMNVPANNFCLRTSMNEFVRSMTDRTFAQWARTITKELTGALNFKIESSEESVLSTVTISTTTLTFHVGRLMRHAVPSKAFMLEHRCPREFAELCEARVARLHSRSRREPV